MLDSLIWLAIGLGAMWHGLQIVWVAPTPSQFKPPDKPPEKGSANAFQLFWLNQYAWIGIGLSILGAVAAAYGLLR